MNIRLDGKTAVVTGAARGIGLAIASAMHESGAAVALADLDLPAARDAAGALGDRAHAFAVDVGEVGSCRNLVSSVMEQLGQIDILVNNAGICPLRPLEEVDQHFFDRMVPSICAAPTFCRRRRQSTCARGRRGASSTLARSAADRRVSGYLGVRADEGGAVRGDEELREVSRAARHGEHPWRRVRRRLTLCELERPRIWWRNCGRTVPLARLGLPQDYGGGGGVPCIRASRFHHGRDAGHQGGIRMD